MCCICLEKFANGKRPKSDAQPQEEEFKEILSESSLDIDDLLEENEEENEEML